MNEFYVIHEAQCRIESSNTTGLAPPTRYRFKNNSSFLLPSPPQLVYDRVTALEAENETLRQSLAHAQDAFSIVASAHDRCIDHSKSSGWSAEQVKGLREISCLIRHALNVRNSGKRYTGNEDLITTCAQIESLKQQLAREKSARCAAERKLSRYLKDKRKPKESSVPKIDEQDQD